MTAPQSVFRLETPVGGREGTPQEKQQVAREIIGFLRHCKELHSPACIGVVKSYLTKMESQARSGTPSPRAALRWIFMAARERESPQHPAEAKWAQPSLRPYGGRSLTLSVGDGVKKGGRGDPLDCA